MARVHPSNPQLDLLFLADEDTPDHFMFSITYHCSVGWHDKCGISKCYCLCHYRLNRAGKWVKNKKDEIKAELVRKNEDEWQATLDREGLLPRETPMTDKDIGFKCECGKRHEYDAFVFAHMHVKLVHSCDCGRRHNILQGNVTLINQLKTKPKKQ